MKAYCIVTTGRQEMGDMITVRFEKAYLSLEKAQAHIDTLAKRVVESIQTPAGPMQFVCERGLHEIDIEE